MSVPDLWNHKCVHSTPYTELSASNCQCCQDSSWCWQLDRTKQACSRKVCYLKSPTSTWSLSHLRHSIAIAGGLPPLDGKVSIYYVWSLDLLKYLLLSGMAYWHHGIQQYCWQCQTCAGNGARRADSCQIRCCTVMKPFAKTTDIRNSECYMCTIIVHTRKNIAPL